MKNAETKFPVRVRFAPSPTGHLHIGGLRTALFNWLFARHNQGVFLMRIEDTDLERSRQEYTDAIMQALDWMSLEADEPVLVQSTRINEHKKIIAQLLEQGRAYRCYCASEEITARFQGQGEIYFYDGHCRSLVAQKKDKPFVVRFKVPEDQRAITFNDLIRGPITFEREQLDDFIIARSDGSPMYNFVVVIDDAYMRISHIIRGEDHISNTPKQIMLYQACGYPVPAFAHLPLILGSSGNRLSKRDAAVSVLDYRAQGYLPDALFNYLVRLGWSHGDQELFTREELITFFTLEHVGKKGSIFDMQKLDWLNGTYIRAMDDYQLFHYMLRIGLLDAKKQLPQFSESQIIDLIHLYKERAKTVREIADELIRMHTVPSAYDQEGIQKWVTPETKEHLIQLIDTLRNAQKWDHDHLSALIKTLCEKLQIKLGALAQPIRIALTGGTTSPTVFQLLTILGQVESLKRIDKLQSCL